MTTPAERASNPGDRGGDNAERDASSSTKSELDHIDQGRGSLSGWQPTTHKPWPSVKLGPRHPWWDSPDNPNVPR